MQTKILSVLLASTATLSLLAGCGTSAEPAADEVATTEQSLSTTNDSNEITTINFYEHSDNEKIAKQQAEEYEKLHPDVKVNLSIIANDDYDDKIKVMLSGGADIDAFWCRGGDQIRQMANGGAVYALDDLMASNGVNFEDYGQMGQAYQTGGHTYGLCTTKSCWLLFYNKTLFDEAGIDIPSDDMTWDEYADLCKQLTTEDKNGGVCVNWIMNTGSAAAQEYLTSDDLSKTRKYVEFLNRIYNEDQSNPSLEEMSGSFDVNALFAEGNTYMMLNGDWTFLLFPDSNPDFEWGAAPIPHFEDVPAQSTVGSTSAYCIAKSSKNPEAAFDFIKFCCYSDEGADIYAQNAGVSAYPSDKALETYKKSVTIPGTEYVFSAKVSSEDGNEDYYNELKDAYKAEITEYLIGNCTEDEAFDNYVTRRQEIMNK